MSRVPVEATANWQIAKLRAGALTVDATLVSFVVLLPIFFNLAALPAFEANMAFVYQLGRAIAHDRVVAISLFLLLTPIPLIYWRICFRNLMQSRTPGEILFGILPVFNRRTNLLFKETVYAILQYLYLVITLVLGTFAYVLFTVVFLGFFGIFLGRVYSLLPLFFFVVWIYCLKRPLLLCHCTRSRATPTSSGEDFLGLETTIVEKKPSNPYPEIEVAS